MNRPRGMARRPETLLRIRNVLHRLAVTLLLGAPLAPALAQNLQWTRQIGTAVDENAYGVAADPVGNTYVTGYTYGDFGGPNAGLSDIFLTKFDPSGGLLWNRQTGSAGDDYAKGVAIDIAGNAYITGYTDGDLGGPSVGNGDIFLTKYDSAGNQLWMHQIGAAGTQYGNQVAVDRAGNAYVSGATTGNLGGPNAGGWDIFLAKYDASGSLLWLRQTGSDKDELVYGFAVDSDGNTYMTGTTEGELGGPASGNLDIFLAKYDAAGTQLWVRQIGTPAYDYAFGMAVDAVGNAYVTGVTEGNLGAPNAGETDIFLSKFDASGNQLWICQSDGGVFRRATSVAVNSVGEAYVTGYAYSNLGGQNLGRSDIFLNKYNPAGSLLWTTQTGTTAYDFATSAAVDAAGNVYIAGLTDGNLGGPSAGGRDIFLVKYGAVPACSPADIAGGSPLGNEPDGTVDGTDFIAFINSFAIGDAAVDPLADIAGGGDTGQEPDGTIDGTDFIFFINAFAIGC